MIESVFSFFVAIPLLGETDSFSRSEPNRFDYKSEERRREGRGGRLRALGWWICVICASGKQKRRTRGRIDLLEVEKETRVGWGGEARLRREVPGYAGSAEGGVE